MNDMNESAASLRWLFDGIGGPLAEAWCETRDRMRVPTGQTFVSPTDGISDPWVVRGIAPASFLPILAPMYDPPDEVDAWPDFQVSTTLSRRSSAFRPTRHEALGAIIADAKPGNGDNEDAVREFLDSEQRIALQGDDRMVFGEHVRSWILSSVGSLLRGAVFAPAGFGEDAIANGVVERLEATRRLTLPQSWVASNAFGDRYLELLLNLTLEENGSFSPIDPLDIRVGQGIVWQKAWRWLSRDVPPAPALDALRLAARMLRSRGLLSGLGHALAARGPESRELATGVLRRWVLTLKAMAWAEHALCQTWDVVRPADIVAFAFSAIKPEWPRRLFAISHRSYEVKPILRHLNVWTSARCAIDATYVPAWETNSGLIWGLFAATPALVRVRSPAYEASLWCRREIEMIEHLRERADFFSGRLAADIELDQLSVLDEWETGLRHEPRRPSDIRTNEFPAFGTEVWSPRTAESLDLTVMRAAGALRLLCAFIGDANLVNRVVGTLRELGDFPVPPAATNHPGGWPSYAAVFRDLDRLTGSAPSEPCAIQVPGAYTADDLARDRAISEFIPDLASGVPDLGDVLVAVEFLRTVWPVMVDQRRGRNLILNLQGLTRRQWQEDPAWSLHRGLAALRGLPVPLWFLQTADQGLSDWEIAGDPPILTEHLDAQFGWMLEAHADTAAWRAAYPDHSGLIMSPALRELHQPR